MIKLYVEGVCPLHIEWVGIDGDPTPPPTTSRAPGDSQAAINSEVSPRCRGRRFAQQGRSNGHMVVALKKKKILQRRCRCHMAVARNCLQAVASVATDKEKMGAVPPTSNYFYNTAPIDCCN